MSGCDIAEPHPWSKEADDEGHVRCTQCGTIGPLLETILTRGLRVAEAEMDEEERKEALTTPTVPPVAGALTEKWLGRLFYLSVAMTSDLRSHEFAELKVVLETLRSQNREMREALSLLWKGGLEETRPGTGPGTVKLFNSLRWGQVKKALEGVEP